MRIVFIAAILMACPKVSEPEGHATEKIEVEWPEDEDLEDLPEAGEDEED